MSSQNTSVPLNDLYDHAENCDRENVTIQEEIVNKLDVKIEHSDSENVDVAIKDETINKNAASNTKEEIITMPDANIKSDDTKCDTCNSADVENITHSLAEKVNIEDVPEVVQAECDIRNTEITDKRVLPVTPGGLINRANRLDISEDILQDGSSDSSAVVLKLQTDSLKSLLAYDSSSDDDDAELVKNWQMRTSNKSESESVSDSDSESSNEDESESDSDSDSESNYEDDDDEVENDIESKKKRGKHKSKMELPTTEDRAEDELDCEIDVEKEEFLHVGHIEAFIEYDEIITVEVIPGTPTCNLETYLFIEDDKNVKKLMGKIDDVMGCVTSPKYCIKFPSPRNMTDLNLKQRMKVFCAPKSKYTEFLCIEELMRYKGTDASWVGDVELPPEIAAQMSDDECESETSEPRKAYKRKHGTQGRHRQFEEDMNHCNTLNNHATRLVDAHRHVPRTSQYNDHIQRVNDTMAQTNRLPPLFDPTVPPPGFHPFPMRSQPIMRPSMVWTRHQPVPMRPPRDQSFMGHSHGRFANSYYNNDMSHGPGTSSHPH